MIIGVDVGGTFTDLVLWDGSLRVGKVSTTADQSEGVVAGATGLTAGARLDMFLHGTTIATNALLERKGARTALIATSGFGDVLEIGRQDRPSLYDPFVDRPAPLVDAGFRFEAAERSGPSGEAWRDLEEVDSLVAAIVAAGPEAIALSLLYSYAAPAAERAIAAALRARLPGAAISLSSDVVPEFREFERMSTTVLNAYLMPITGRYLDRLVTRASAVGLCDDIAVMRSSGGLMPAAGAAGLPAAILLSGPAGGVVAAAELGRALGTEHVISFDMGGTSSDVCRIDAGRPDVEYERGIDGYPCRMPSVAVHTVGAGGGSIGWVDAGGALRVGPQSAGALPGPACYGRGGIEPTVTDANVALGRIDPASRLAGTLAVRADLATVALADVGSRLGIGAQQTALGMLEIVEAHMVRAIRTVSVEQGADPRRAVLVAFGGAGALHATALARSLDMAGVVVPPFAGVFSALGLLLSPPRADAARTVLVRPEAAGLLDTAVEEVAAEARVRLTSAGVAASDLSVETLVDARYLGQSHETPVSYRAGEGWEALQTRFHAAHRERNGFARPGDPIEAVTVRAEATAPPAMTWDRLPPVRPAGVARRGTRSVLTPEGPVGASLWWRPGLEPGATIAGPAVIEEPEATTYLAPGERARVHDSGALEVVW